VSIVGHKKLFSAKEIESVVVLVFHIIILTNSSCDQSKLFSGQGKTQMFLLS